MKRILITGASGYIATNLTSYFASCDYEVVTVSRQLLNPSFSRHYTADLTDPSVIANIIEKVKPDIVIHTVWINSLAKCEIERQLADFVNVELSRNIIAAIQSVNSEIRFAFISSDYVFDGEKGNYTEEDECKPKTYYGKTKVIVEDLIRNSGLKHLICRTANVFCNGGKFFTFLYEKLFKNKTVDVYYDAFFTPTYMQYFLDSFERLLAKDIEGTIHLSGVDRISRYNFAFQLAAAMGKREDLVIPRKIPSDMLIAHDVSLDSTRQRKLNANYCPTIERSLQFLLGRLEYPYFSFIDPRGSITGITQTEHSWEEINYIESVQGAVRGGHYHKQTHEGFFIIEGKIKVEVQNLATSDKSIFVVRKGDAFYIEPSFMHTFHIIENAKWINFLSKAMKGDEKDIHYEGCIK